MCRKAERDRDRERYATRQRIEGKLVRQYNRKLSRYEQVLNAAITAHIWDRECKRLGVTVDNS
jgi:hypothetical protein